MELACIYCGDEEIFTRSNPFSSTKLPHVLDWTDLRMHARRVFGCSIVKFLRIFNWLGGYKCVSSRLRTKKKASQNHWFGSSATVCPYRLFFFFQSGNHRNRKLIVLLRRISAHPIILKGGAYKSSKLRFFIGPYIIITILSNKQTNKQTNKTYLHLHTLYRHLFFLTSIFFTKV